MTTTQKAKSFFEMTAAEKAAFVRKVERGIPVSQLKPLSARDKALWKAAKRGPGRPRKLPGDKAVPVRVTFEPGLLKAIDAGAARKGISRAEFLARGAKLVLEVET
jgi:hypothetical protein